MTPYKFVLHSKGLFVEASDAPEVLARLQYPKPVDGAEDHYRTWREVAASEHQRILSELVEKGEYVLHANESKQPILVGSGHHGSLMKREDLVRFYARVGIQLTIHEADPRQSDEAGTAGPVPAVAVPEPRPANAEPQPLTTGEIAFCFDGAARMEREPMEEPSRRPAKMACCVHRHTGPARREGDAMEPGLHRRCAGGQRASRMENRSRQIPNSTTAEAVGRGMENLRS